MGIEASLDKLKNFKTKRIHTSNFLKEIRKHYEKNFYHVRKLRAILEQGYSAIQKMDQSQCRRLISTGNTSKIIKKEEILPETPKCLEFICTDKPLPKDGVALSDVYTLLSKIGQGGTSKIYLAKDQNLDIFCVIKVILQCGSEESRQKFYAEIQTTAKLRHPHIVNIYYANHIAQYFYYVMEYIEGASCEEILKKRKFSIYESIYIAMSVAKALQYAHERKIIHRDVKPANIMIGNDGSVKLLDLGLALNPRFLNTQERDKIVGTPYYLSPEQARAEFDEINEKTDIYCLGSTLYHLLTGRVPFPGKHLSETITMVANPELPPNPPSILRSEIPKELEKAVLKCMAKKQIQRYQSMEEVIQSLQKITEEL